MPKCKPACAEFKYSNESPCFVKIKSGQGCEVIFSDIFLRNFFVFCKFWANVIEIYIFKDVAV